MVQKDSRWRKDYGNSQKPPQFRNAVQVLHLLARVNLFLTFTENWIEKLGFPISASWAIAVATRISWNIWQMDGLKDTVPGTDTLCLIFDWEENKKVTFRQIKEESDNV